MYFHSLEGMIEKANYRIIYHRRPCVFITDGISETPKDRGLPGRVLQAEQQKNHRPPGVRQEETENEISICVGFL